MPIIADPFTISLAKDRKRYLDLISGKLHDIEINSDAGLLKTYVLQDTTVEGLADYHLLLAVSANYEIEYACYFTLAKTPDMGVRVVQTEVRSDVPDLARDIMLNYFLHDYDSMRCDITTTAAGLRMWEKFYKEHQENFDFFLADVSIDTTTQQGCWNQNPAYAETYENKRPVTLDFFSSRNTNRDSSATVIYAVNKGIL